MTLERAKELLQLQVDLGGGYNRNAARVILAEVQRQHGQEAVDRLIRDLDLERHFGLRPGTAFHY
jgi:hypothetical protein